MAESGAPGAIRENDYEALLGALTETDRGRWFLDEYMRRNQKPETQVVLDAIARLEKTMTRERTVPSIDRIRLDIADMQEAIERTKREIANIKHESDDGNRFIEASNELDAIVTKTEAATQEILAAARGRSRNMPGRCVKRGPTRRRATTSTPVQQRSSWPAPSRT